MFCSHRLFNDFCISIGWQVIAIAPRREALETPINDPKKETNNKVIII